MAIYITMTLGTFAVILSMRRSGGMVESIRSVRGPRTHPSDQSLPPGHVVVLVGRHSTARGFFAKFYVFLAAINAGLDALAVIGVLTSVVGCDYYLAIVRRCIR